MSVGMAISQIENLDRSGAASGWRRGLRRVFVCMAMLAGLPEIAGAMAIPVGVVYHPADESTNARAIDRLTAALIEPGSKDYERLFGAKRGSPPVLVGNFLATALGSRPDFDRDRLRGGILKYELTAEIKLDAQIFVAESKKQRRYLADLLQNMVPTGSEPSIRKLGKEELAIIWRLISWDIEEPIFVAEWPGRKFVFDLDGDSSTLQWVEDLSEPCFSLHQEDVEVLPCHCMVATGEGLALSVMYEQRPELECSHNAHAKQPAPRP